VLKKGVTKVRIPDLLVIIMVRKDILLMCVGARMSINMKNLKPWVIVISAIRKDIRHMNVGLKPSRHQDLKVTTTTVRSMDIEHLNADPSLCSHQTNQQRQKFMDITTIRITKLGKVVNTIKNMDTFLRTTLEHTLVVTTIDG